MPAGVHTAGRRALVGAGHPTATCVDTDRSSFHKRLPAPAPRPAPSPSKPLCCLQGRTQIPRQGGQWSALVGHLHTKLGASVPSRPPQRAHDAQCVAEPTGHVGLSMHRCRTEPRLGSQGASVQGPRGGTEWTEAQLPRTPARNTAAGRPTCPHPVKARQTCLQAGTLLHKCPVRLAEPAVPPALDSPSPGSRCREMHRAHGRQGPALGLPPVEAQRQQVLTCWQGPDGSPNEA